MRDEREMSLTDKSTYIHSMSSHDNARTYNGRSTVPRVARRRLVVRRTDSARA
jgi:hypothetical protein